MPGPARPVKRAMRTVSPSSAICAAMSVTCTPCAKSCTSPPASRAVPDRRGAADRARDAGIERQLAARPPAVRGEDRVEQREIDIARRAQIERPRRVDRRRAGHGQRGQPARRRGARRCRAVSPARSAVAVRLAGGSARPGPVRIRSPVASTRIVPLGRAVVPVSFASARSVPSASTAGANGLDQVGRDVAHRDGQVERRRERGRRPRPSPVRSPSRSRSTVTPPPKPDAHGGEQPQRSRPSRWPPAGDLGLLRGRIHVSRRRSWPPRPRGFAPSADSRAASAVCGPLDGELARTRCRPSPRTRPPRACRPPTGCRSDRRPWRRASRARPTPCPAARRRAPPP